MARHREPDPTTPLGSGAVTASSRIATDTIAPTQPTTPAGKFLVRCGPLAGLPATVADAVGAHLQPVDFQQEDLLLRQGEPGPGLLAIESGEAEIAVADGAGKESIVAIVGPNSIVGEMSLLTGEPCTASVRALRSVRAWSLKADLFHELARQHPPLSVLLTHLVASRLGNRQRDILGGKTLGGYRVGRRLGKGGMAVVYAGAHLETGQRVALKMMSHRLTYDAEALERFQREADVVQSLDHPNIARLLGRFEAFHTFFLVMELCEGPTVHDLINELGPLSERMIRGLIGQLAAALVHAHSRGIIHRDLKPANVIVTDAGQVKLTDFGLARSLSAPPELTQRGMLVGTPRYMAPELLGGKTADVQSDIFSFGLILYEMLAGKPRFDQNDLLALLYQQMSSPLPKREALHPGMSDELDQALRGCLADNPQLRSVDWDLLISWAQPVKLPAPVVV